MENIELALTLLIAGFVIVFVVLILLIAIITLYGKIIQSAQNAVSNKRENAVYGSKPHKIKNIRRSRSVRSSWGNAGIAENTKPF